MTTEELAIILTAKFDQVEKALSTVEGKVGNYAKTSVKANESVTKSFGILGEIINLKTLSWVGLGLAIKGFVIDSIEAAEESERVAAVLNTMAKNAGISKQKVNDQTKAMEDLGLTSSEAAQALAVFIRNGVPFSKALNLTQTALEIAAANGAKVETVLKDINSAVDLGSGRMLRQYGITINANAALERYAATHGKFKDALSESEQKAAILDEILKQGTKLSGSQAEAFGTQADRARKLAVEYDRLKDSAGGAFLQFKKDMTSGLGAAFGGINMAITGPNGETPEQTLARFNQGIQKNSSATVDLTAVTDKQKQAIFGVNNAYQEEFRLVQMQHAFVLVGLQQELAKIEERRQREIKSVEESVENERMRNQLIKEINQTSDLQRMMAEQNFSKMSLQEQLAYLQELKANYVIYTKDKIAIDRMYDELVRQKQIQQVENQKAIYTDFSNFFASSFANSVNIFQKQAYLMERAFESAINHMVQKIIESAILDLMFAILGMGSGGNLETMFSFGAGKKPGFDDPVSDRRAESAGTSKWLNDAKDHFSEGYTRAALAAMGPNGNIGGPGGGGKSTENHYHYSPMFSAGSPNDIRTMMIEFTSMQKREGLTS